MFLSQQ
jgi:phosphoribosylamine--glycine ligase / phosphoribosylformylglycinamidine cyclo-ligase